LDRVARADSILTGFVVLSSPRLGYVNRAMGDTGARHLRIWAHSEDRGFSRPPAIRRARAGGDGPERVGLIR